ncbi:MAG: hypothetical protein ACTHMM_16645 [Agriterribacter sp.]
MPLDQYLKVRIGDMEAQVTDPRELPVSIDYALEDPENFQDKLSGQAQSVKIPATLLNDKAANTYRNPDVNDMTEGEVFRSTQKCVIESSGYELLIGKAFLKAATHNDQPKEYEFDLYGDNADWKVDLESTTFYDLLKHITFIFENSVITNSWNFDGTNEHLTYVFAPVRYRDPVGGYITIQDDDGNDTVVADDRNLKSIYLKPSLSKYWLLYWGFKAAGYRLKSDFFDTDYFRRQVMPWTWGNFLYSEGSRLDDLKFLAKGVEAKYMNGGDSSLDHVPLLLQVTNTTHTGGFDNNGVYSYDQATGAMNWEYLDDFEYGTLIANFHLQVNVDTLISVTGRQKIYLQWLRNGVEIKETIVYAKTRDVAIRYTNNEVLELWEELTVNEGDIITARMYVTLSEGGGDTNRVIVNMLAFTIDYFRIPLGGEINFENYLSLKNYKWIDLLRGVIDEFNLSINTDSLNKVVYIEPTHAHYLGNDPGQMREGFFVDDHVDWNGKEDLSKDWVMDNYSDWEQEATIKYQDDQRDGILKKIQDRNQNTLAAAKYIFPDRFKSGKKEVQNRFFSPTMHYEAIAWKDITGIAPQMVCIIPENISNTSNSEAANTFSPKSCYYKGLVQGVGGWVLRETEDATPKVYTSFPYMFAVNYKDGGEHDPILSYSDEKISKGLGYVIGKGLMKRFYLQRFAIMRNGQWYTTWFRLSNSEVAGNMHREYKSYGGHRWELISINGFKPLRVESTQCLLRRWAPVEKRDFDACYPSATNILTGESTSGIDTKYAQLRCLPGDIPKELNT